MTSAQDLHRELLLDHYRHPHHRGLREPFDGEGVAVNPTCGDQVVLRVALAGVVVREVSHEGLGCTLSQASASVLGDLVTGRTVGEGLALRDSFVGLLQRGTAEVTEADEEQLGDAVAFAGVARYPTRVRCALLAWSAFADAGERALAARR